MLCATSGTVQSAAETQAIVKQVMAIAASDTQNKTTTGNGVNE